MFYPLILLSCLAISGGTIVAQTPSAKSIQPSETPQLFVPDPTAPPVITQGSGTR